MPRNTNDIESWKSEWKKTFSAFKGQQITDSKKLAHELAILAQNTRKTIISTSIRNSYHCLVVGVEADGDDKLSKPDVNRPFAPNDVVWIVGEEDNLSKLFAAIE